uniref:Uncharacterized protein n=1 Tax=Plectus sambesii TaxID=2011161 RepID=A0A914X2X3_9BILA
MRPPPPSSDPGQPNRAQVRKMGDRRAMSELTSSSGSSSENESHERRAPARVRRFPSSNNPQLHNDSSESSGRESRLFVRKVSSSDDQQTTEKQRPVIQPGSPTHPIHCGHCGSEGSAVEERASSLQSSQEKAPSEQKLPTSDKVRAIESSLKCEDAVDKKGRLPRAQSSHSSRNRDLAAKISKDMVLASMAHCDLPRQPAPPPTSRRNKRHHKPVYKLYAFHWIEVGLRKALWYLGSAIGGYSTTLMIIPLVVFLLSLIGLAIHRENLTFMAPFGSLFFVSEPLIDTQHRIKVYPVEFNGTNPAYNALQRSSPVEFAVLLKTLSARDTMIKEQSVDAYIKLKQRLHALHVVHGEHVFDWEQLRREEGNERDVIEEILGSGTSIALTYPETVLSINGEKNLSRLFLGTAVGGVETDVDGAISRARALAMTNRLREDLNTDVLSDWDRAFQEQMYRTAEEVPSQGLATCWWSYGGFIDAVTQSSRDVYAWLGLSALLIVVLCALMCFAENSYKSKPILGLTIGLLSLVCAFGGFGIQFGSVGNFNSLVYPILFIVTGISILVMTTMLQAWRKYDNAAVHPTEK